MKSLLRFVLASIVSFLKGRRVSEITGRKVPLSRFLIKRQDTRFDRAHSSALMPYKGETSVYDVTGESQKSIIAIGTKVVAAPQKKPLRGYVIVPSGAFLDNFLKILKDDKPKGHANVRGWPEQKSKQKDIALDILTKATSTAILQKPGKQ